VCQEWGKKMLNNTLSFPLGGGRFYQWHIGIIIICYYPRPSVPSSRSSSEKSFYQSQLSGLRTMREDHPWGGGQQFLPNMTLLPNRNVRRARPTPIGPPKKKGPSRRSRTCETPLRDGEDQGSERLGADRSGLRSGLEQKILKVAPLR
jgi:hypothetical protein